MPTEAELDATLARSREVLARAGELRRQAEESRAAFEGWRAENGLDDEKIHAFVDRLPPEQRARYDAESEAMAVETKHDLERLAQQARGAPRPTTPKRPMRRNMV